MQILEGRIEEYGLTDNKVLVVFVKEEDNFDSNITGLIAMKLTAKYGKPTILVKLSNGDIYKGSARGINDSNLPELKSFLANSKFFEYAEGHQAAFGLGIKKDKVEDFIAYANEVLKDTEFNEKTYVVDYIFSGNETEVADLILNVGAADFWGMGIEMPLIVVEKIHLHRKDIVLMKNDSMKFEHGGVTYTIFKNSQACSDFTEFDLMEVDVCGKANINEWAGRIIPQLFISDYNIRDMKKMF